MEEILFIKLIFAYGSDRVYCYEKAYIFHHGPIYLYTEIHLIRFSCESVANRKSYFRINIIRMDLNTKKKFWGS